ncbi:MAG: DUF167 domain-containing protein [Candidatus Scalindua sp.]|nr:DUF167 domain-containing protein [Candidatus Scalindua sp.]
MIKIRDMNDGIVISIKVQPNARKDKIIGEYGEQLKIAVTEQPEKGKANKAIIKIIAKWLNIKRAKIEIIGGYKSKDKEIFMRNILRKDIDKLVACLAQEAKLKDRDVDSVKSSAKRPFMRFGRNLVL